MFHLKGQDVLHADGIKLSDSRTGFKSREIPVLEEVRSDHGRTLRNGDLKNRRIDGDEGVVLWGVGTQEWLRVVVRTQEWRYGVETRGRIERWENGD